MTTKMRMVTESPFLQSATTPQQSCADPGIFARGVQARLPENSSVNVFFFILVLNLFGLSMVYFKENYIFQGFRGGPTFSRGGPTFSRVVQHFPDGVHFFPRGGV